MDWLSKIIQKFVDKYFEQKAVPKYLSGIKKNVVRTNHIKVVKRSEDLSVILYLLSFLLPTSII